MTDMLAGLSERHLYGLDALAAATTLLQRIRCAHPVQGVLEAADLQWWWRNPRPSDHQPQLFWVDGDGVPQAAVMLTTWSGFVTFDPIVMPGADEASIENIVARGLHHAATLGIGEVELMIDEADGVMAGVIGRRGLERQASERADVEAWITADAVPAATPSADGYALTSRADAPDAPHHMVARAGPEVAARLAQTSLYRPDLDLVVHATSAGAGDVAAYGLFWFDPVSATGLVEPMRTEAAHQQRGLARHVLTVGLNRLVAAGAERIKIVYTPDNDPATGLYGSVGFVGMKQTGIWTGPTGRG